MSQALQDWLETFVSRHGGIAGTVHLLTHASTEPVLELAASLRIPQAVVEATRIIPRGKGMAGLAWERGVPVQTCNLKSDSSGDVRPGAKAVDAQAAVAIPVHDQDATTLRAVVGLAFMGEREFSVAALTAFQNDAATLPR